MKLIEVAAANRIEDIPTLTDWIHDCWFSIDDIRFDEGNACLEIPFTREFYAERRILSGGLLKTIEVPWFKCSLIVKGVSSFKLDDTERVGSYDFSYIAAEDGSLRIVTNIPLDFTIYVEGIDLAVHRNELPEGFKSYRTIFS